MLTYSFEGRGDCGLSEYLYRRIKADILEGRLAPGEKLPSKRALARHLSVSAVTVENTYGQLAAEGYLRPEPRRGFFVPALPPRQRPPAPRPPRRPLPAEGERAWLADFASSAADAETFPFLSWNRTMRETMAQCRDQLAAPSPWPGVPELRAALADYLYQFRGMTVDPSQIVVGAGTEYLYGLIVRLLGPRRCAVEDPGYQKISKIYESCGVDCAFIPLDGSGVEIESLERSAATVLHISPSHHFPTGLVTPVSRRWELLDWASRLQGRVIVEDDYDSEFRMVGRPIPSLQSIDGGGQVIYVNTFSKSLIPTIRISYMVLPPWLMELYRQKLGFYSCTVSNFEQYTLARFIEKGLFEKHVNRMRNYYCSQRDAILACIRKHPCRGRLSVGEENAGLHFLLTVKTDLSDEELLQKLQRHGVRIFCLSQFYRDKKRALEHRLVVNYSGIPRGRLEESVNLLLDSLDDSTTAP